MKPETRARLFKELSYIADNFDQDNPEDDEMWREYRRIKKRLGIPNYSLFKEESEPQSMEEPTNEQ